MNLIKSLWYSSLVSISFMLIKISSFFKVSFIIGSSKALFSGSSITIPLVGYYGGILGSGLLLVIGTVSRSLVDDLYSLHYLAYHIPGFCAALYWACKPGSLISRVTGFIIPALCMMLFLAHPVGNSASAYTFYWFIPMVLSCLRHNHLFWRALTSTFIAHAVGSTIWIYTVPMTAAAWYALIPVVAIERLAFSLGMVLCVYAGAWLKDSFAHYKQRYVTGRRKKLNGMA